MSLTECYHKYAQLFPLILEGSTRFYGHVTLRVLLGSGEEEEQTKLSIYQLMYFPSLSCGREFG